MPRNLVSVYMEGQLKDALKDLEMPESYYDKAITAYESVASGLTSESSALYPHDPEVILQGSIKIGTAIKPITEDGSYDVDMVCNLSSSSRIAERLDTSSSMWIGVRPDSASRRSTSARANSSSMAGKAGSFGLENR